MSRRSIGCLLETADLLSRLQLRLLVVVRRERQAIGKSGPVKAEELVVLAELSASACILLGVRFGIRIPHPRPIGNADENRLVVLQLHVDLTAVAVDAAPDRGR